MHASAPPPPARFPYPPPDPVGRRPELPAGARRGDGLPGWRPWTSVLALITGFLGALFGATVLGVIGAMTGSSFAKPAGWVNLSATIVQDVSLVAAALVFARAWSTPLPRHFGLRPTRFWPALGWATLAWGAFYLFTAVFVAALGLHPSEEDLTKELGVEGTSGIVAIAALVTVVAPMAEEFFFRGYFFTALRNWRGVWPAALITGAVFGAIHAGGSDVAYLAPLGFFGVLLCLLYVRTGSLWPCITLHCANNTLAFGVSQGWSWQIPLVFVAAIATIAVLGRGAVRAWDARVQRGRVAPAA
jgi:membrane protease YdiL (CAAX protease family)